MDYSKSRYQDSLAEELSEGFPDEEIGSVSELGWAGRFNAERAVLTEDSQGFVWVDVHETEESFESHWQEILDTYEEYDLGLVV